MRSVTLKELEDRSRKRVAEEERARRMRALFEKTEFLTDTAFRQAVVRRARPKRTAGVRFPVRGVVLAFTLFSSGAFALNAPVRAQIVDAVERVVSAPRAALEALGERVFPARKGRALPGQPQPAQLAHPEAQAIDEVPPEVVNSLGAPARSTRGGRTQVLPPGQEPSSLLTPAPAHGASAKAQRSLGSTRPSLPKPAALAPAAALASSAEPVAPAPSARELVRDPDAAHHWEALARSLEGGDLRGAQRQADSLIGSTDPKVRESARLVRAQIELRRTGKLSASVQAELRALAVSASSATVRREAAHLLEATP